MYRYFKCAQWATSFCKGSMKQNITGDCVIIKEHNHGAMIDNEVDIIKQFREALKERAKNDPGLLKNLYIEESLVLVISYNKEY